MNTVNIGPCKLYYGPQDNQTYLGYTESGVTVTVSPLSYSERLAQQTYDSNHIVIYKSAIIDTNLVEWNLNILNILSNNTSYTEEYNIDILSFTNIPQGINISDMKSLKVVSTTDNEQIICNYVYPKISLNNTFQKKQNSIDIEFYCYYYDNKFIDFT